MALRKLAEQYDYSRKRELPKVAIGSTHSEHLVAIGLKFGEFSILTMVNICENYKRKSNIVSEQRLF